MFNGDVNLSCTMTFISTLGSFAFTSLWAFLLGSPLIGKNISIPYTGIASSLASFTLPLFLGMLFKVGHTSFLSRRLPFIPFQYKWEKQATLLLDYISRPFFFLVLLTFPIISVWNFSYFFYLCSWQHFLAGTALGAGGYICGALLAALVKQGRAQIVAISLETAIQNGGIAFVVVNLTFDSPYSDMATIPILSMFFFATGPVMFLVYGGYWITRFGRRF